MPKKVKKTKAQLEEERIQAEEAERKAKDSEEKKIADEIEKKRLEALRVQAEHQAFRKAERERLIEEHKVTEEIRKDRLYEMKAEEAKEISMLEWVKYKEPSEEPDASSEKDLNTFITQAAEIQAQTLTEVLDLTKKVEHVAKAVEERWGDSVASGDNIAREKAEGYISKFSQIIQERIDIATAHLLRFADDHINDRNEIQVEEKLAGVSIGLWSSYSDIRPIRKSVNFEKVGIQLDIPKQILQHDARFIHRVVRFPIETMSYSAFHPDAGKPGFLGQTEKYVVGDLLLMDILRPPPQAFNLRAKKWIMRDRSSQSMTLQKSPYPSSVACRCFLRVPEEVFMTEDVTIAIWNAETKQWTEEGLTDYTYSETTRQCQFYTTTVGIFALVKDRIAEMPFKSWSLCPLRALPVIVDPLEAVARPASYEKQARLTVQTQRVTIVIDIDGNTCKLTEPNVKQLADLINIPSTPGALLHKLLRRGINIFPSPQDALRCPSLKNPIKNAQLEAAVLAEISRCAGGFEFSSTTWNQSLPDTQIALFARETSIFTGAVDSFDYETILAEQDDSSTSFKNAADVGLLPSPGIKYIVVMGNEYGTKTSYSATPRPGEVTHFSLSMAMERQVMPEALDRIRRTNARFQKTVLTLLEIIRPLSLN